MTSTAGGFFGTCKKLPRTTASSQPQPHSSEHFSHKWVCPYRVVPTNHPIIAIMTRETTSQLGAHYCLGQSDDHSPRRSLSTPLVSYNLWSGSYPASAHKSQQAWNLPWWFSRWSELRWMIKRLFDNNVWWWWRWIRIYKLQCFDSTMVNCAQSFTMSHYIWNSLNIWFSFNILFETHEPLYLKLRNN